MSMPTYYGEVSDPSDIDSDGANSVAVYSLSQFDVSGLSTVQVGPGTYGGGTHLESIGYDPGSNELTFWGTSGAQQYLNLDPGGKYNLIVNQTFRDEFGSSVAIKLRLADGTVRGSGYISVGDITAITIPADATSFELFAERSDGSESAPTIGKSSTWAPAEDYFVEVDDPGGTVSYAQIFQSDGSPADAAWLGTADASELYIHDGASLVALSSVYPLPPFTPDALPISSTDLSQSHAIQGADGLQYEVIDRSTSGFSTETQSMNLLEVAGNVLLQTTYNGSSWTIKWNGESLTIDSGFTGNQGTGVLDAIVQLINQANAEQGYVIPATFAASNASIDGQYTGSAATLVAEFYVEGEQPDFAVELRDPTNYEYVANKGAAAVVTTVSEGTSEFLDLRSLSSDGYIYLGGIGSQESGTDGTALRPDYDQIINFATGDTLDVSSYFDGVILSGTATDTGFSEVEYDGAADVADVVVFAGGYGASIDLGDGDATEDVISFRGTQDGVALTLDENAHWNTATLESGENVSLAGVEIVVGSDADDVITGYQTEANIIAGGAGDDIIVGGSDGDVLLGGTGYNTITGSAGDDLIINLGAGLVSGGTGDDKDVFVVRGTDADAATFGVAKTSATALDDHTDTTVATTTKIDSLSVSRDGLSREARDTTNHEDRIVFNVNATAVSMMATDMAVDLSMATGFSVDQSMYSQVAENLVVDVTAIPENQIATYIAELWYVGIDGGVNPGEYLLLGRAEFTLDAGTQADAGFAAERLNAVILDQVDIFAGASDELVYALSNADPLAVADGTAVTNDGTFETDGSMNITVAFERFDKAAVVGDGEISVLLGARDQDTGLTVATRFRGSEADEVMVATGLEDTVQIFNSTLTSDYGVDVLIERGGGSAGSAATTTDTDGLVERTTSDGDAIQIDLSASSLLSSSLDLSRFERAREGDDASLRIQHDGSEMSGFTQVVYKQYGDDDRFRVEDLALLNGDIDDSSTVDVNEGLSYYSLGQVTDTGLTLSGGADGILVGSYTKSETFEVTVDPADRGTGGHFEQEVYLFDFDQMNDRIDINGDYTIDTTSVMMTEYDANNDQTMDGTEVSMNTTEGDTLSFYFVGTTLTQDVFDDVTLAVGAP